MIEPTPGRVVWYRAGAKDPLRSEQDDRPLPAILCWVNSPTSVNLSVFDRSGRTHPRVHVLLVQDDNGNSLTESYCHWMPYQKGQAAKTEALAAALEISPLPKSLAAGLTVGDGNKLEGPEEPLRDADDTFGR